MAKKKYKNSSSNGSLKKVILIITVLVLAGFVYWQFFRTPNTASKTKAIQGYTAFDFVKQGELTFNSKGKKFLSKIDIEIADDAQKQATGLMYRDRMKENQGMLFIFQKEDYQSFWMHNTQLPLDMIFVNKNLDIVTIRKNTTPFSDQSYSSTKPAMYVIEVNAGYCDRNNIKVGDKIVWRRT